MKKIFSILGLLFSILYFSQAGNVGINTSNPAEKLHIKGTMRYEPLLANPNQPSAGKVLTSDANGNASWQNQDLRTTYLASYTTVPSNLTFPLTNNDTAAGATSPAYYTGTSITLPKGDWIVILSMNVQGEFQNSSSVWLPLTSQQAIWTRVIMSSNTTTNPNYQVSSDTNVIGANLVSGILNDPATNTLIYGELFVKQTEATKTYYIKASIQGFSASPTPTSVNPVNIRIKNPAISPNITSENKIFAIPVSFN